MRQPILLTLLLGGCATAPPPAASEPTRSVAPEPPAPPTVRVAGSELQDVSGLPRVALVIGNGNYEEIPKLANPPRDARHVAARLAQAGFQVTLELDANRDAMLDAIGEFGDRLRPEASDQAKPVGLFYFAGHGVQYRGNNYLIPLDAKIREPSDVEGRAVGVSYVLRKMEDAGNPFNVVVLDACRDNPYVAGNVWAARDRSAGSRGLAFMDAPAGTLLAYATAPGQVASEGEPGAFGVFTGAFLKHSARPGLPVEDVLKAVAEEVQDQTEGRQIPWRSTNFTGRFAFEPCPAGATFNGVNCGEPVVECNEGTWDGERCVLEKLDCPPGFTLEADRGCRRE